MKLLGFLTPTVALLAFACGPSQKTDETPTASPTAEPTTAPDSTPTGEPSATSEPTPRAKQTGLIAKALREPNMDPHWYARMVAVGLTEGGEYKLAAPWGKTFDVISKGTVDPSQCETLVAVTIEEELKSAVKKRCGAGLGGKLKAAKTPAARIDVVTKACKIEGVKGTDGVTAWGVVAAALIEDELAAQSETTPEEKAFVPHLRALCTMKPA